MESTSLFSSPAGWFVVLFSLVILILILRPFWLWYYKINDRIKNQQEIINLMRKAQGMEEKNYYKKSFFDF